MADFGQSGDNTSAWYGMLDNYLWAVHDYYSNFFIWQPIIFGGQQMIEPESDGEIDVELF